MKTFEYSDFGIPGPSSYSNIIILLLSFSILIINFFALKKNLLFNPGYISSVFLILYSFFRIFSEIFREPDAHIGLIFNYFSLGVVLSILSLIAGLFIFLFIRKNEQNN